MSRHGRIFEETRSRTSADIAVKPPAPHHSPLAWQHRIGNRLADRLLHSKPRLEPAGSEREKQAGRGEIPSRAVSAPSTRLLSGGQPLPGNVRAPMERRFGQSFAPVRVHTGWDAAKTAEALDARAFAVGEDLVFGEGQYTPSSAAGQSLLSHELTHVVQQRDSGPSIARQPRGGDEPAKVTEDTPPPVHIGGAGLTLFPGPLRPRILGSPIPLPGSLRLTNALDVGSGQPYVLDLDPHQFVATLLGELDLSSSPRAGTPEGRLTERSAQQRTRLKNTQLRLDTKTGRIRGTATMLVGSEYPETLKDPTEVDVSIESSELGKFDGRLGYGPLHADFKLTLSYDRSRLERAARPVFAPSGGFAGFWSELARILHGAAPGINLSGSAGDGLMSLVREVLAGRFNGEQFAIQTLALLGQSIPATADRAQLQKALKELGEEFSHPGFHLVGGLSLGPVPLSHFEVTAPTTRPISRPLLGAPTKFPSTISAYGTVIAPAGSITDIPVPAFGGLYSRFDEKQGFSAIGGLLPTISPDSISAGKPFAAQFPVFLFAEVSYVRRVSDSLDLGVRVSGQLSTPQLLPPQPPSTDPVQRFQQFQSSYQDAINPQSKLSVPNIGLTVFGRFGGPL